MKYYALSVVLILAGALFSASVPFASDSIEKALISTQVSLAKETKVSPEKVKTLSPPISQGIPVPDLSANAVLVKDLDTDTILFQKNVNVSLPIASTTKIMTALVAEDFFKPNSILTVEDAARTGGARVGFFAGEQLSYRSALYAMLLNSGNDAAFTIAENYPGGVSEFVSAMNKRAQDLYLRNTHFANPAGFDDPKHFASAADLAKITAEALKYPQIARVVSTKDTEISSIDKRHTHKLHNLNQLLSSVPGVLGVKTGYTELAKENLVTLVERERHRILTIVLGSDDRFGDSAKLIDWSYRNYLWL